MVFNNCTMYQDCQSEIKPQLIANGSICFWAPRFEVVVHFECSNNEFCFYECHSDEHCIRGECFIRTLLASHRLLITGKEAAFMHFH
jgi:hypothetical protein